MKWARRKNADGLTEYVSGEYVLEPCHNGFCHADLPKVIGWDVRFGAKRLRYNGDESTFGDGSSTFKYTVRLLADAKQVAEQHVLNEELRRLGREHPLEPARAERLYRRVLTVVGVPADELETKLKSIMEERESSVDPSTRRR